MADEKKEITTFNRTIEELKSGGKEDVIGQLDAFNRTIEELKSLKQVSH